MQQNPENHATGPETTLSGKPHATPEERAAAEFKRARQATWHSKAEVADALGVNRSTVGRWESGSVMPPQDVLEWLYLNRNQYPADRRPLTKKGEPRGSDVRAQRAKQLLDEFNLKLPEKE